MSLDAILDIQHVSCQRGFRTLFEDLNVSLYAGQLLRICGENGAGKTTLIRVLSGLSTDYEGRILYAGRSRKAFNEDMPWQISYLGHEKGVKANLSVIENLQWYAALYPSCTNQPDKLQQVLSRLGLAAFAHVRACDLSAGQKQRLALARLMLSEAKLWILDEPFTAIDQSGIRVFEQLIDEFLVTGGSVVMTAHHSLSLQSEIRELHLTKPQQYSPQESQS